MSMLQEVWGWQPALYLFLGGMGAGAFIAAGALYLMDKSKMRRTVCASMWAALACLVVGLLLLLSELVFPVRGLMMWQSFSHFTSWMTLGAWGAFLAIIVFAASALLATPVVVSMLSSKWKALKGSVDKIRRVLAIVGIVLSAFVAVYTGMLLSAVPGVPLWNTLLLPCLFTVSALDTGIALTEVIAVVAVKRSSEEMPEKTRALAERTVIVLVVLELVVLALLVGSMLGADASTASGAAAALSGTQLVSGVLAPWFWILIVVVGLVLPLSVAVMLSISKKASFALPMTVGALGALVGGCALRFVILADGIHAEYVMNALMSLIS